MPQKWHVLLCCNHVSTCKYTPVIHGVLVGPDIQIPMLQQDTGIELYQQLTNWNAN